MCFGVSWIGYFVYNQLLIFVERIYNPSHMTTTLFAVKQQLLAVTPLQAAEIFTLFWDVFALHLSFMFRNPESVYFKSINELTLKKKNLLPFYSRDVLLNIFFNMNIQYVGSENIYRPFNKKPSN